MKAIRTTAALLLFACCAGLHAEPAKTRDEVKAELAEALRTGDMYANGDSGEKLNELYPWRYPHAATAPLKTRAEVRSETMAAIRAGDVLAPGESGLTLRELNPQRYPAPPVLAGKSRDEVRAELAEAIRTGDMISSDQSGLKLNEEFPQRYAHQRSTMATGHASAESYAPAASAMR